MKNKSLYYILNLTWGIPMNIIGALAAAALIAIGKKPSRHGGCYHFEIGENWGGVNLGLVIITDKDSPAHTKNHEFGHSIQNAYFGFLMPFIVAIPSFIRYWVREIQYRLDKPPKTEYDDIWFEGQATRLGNEYIKYWEVNKED